MAMGVGLVLSALSWTLDFTDPNIAFWKTPLAAAIVVCVILSLKWIDEGEGERRGKDPADVSAKEPQAPGADKSS
jgi:hypothetical protein